MIAVLVWHTFVGIYFDLISFYSLQFILPTEYYYHNLSNEVCSREDLDFVCRVSFSSGCLSKALREFILDFHGVDVFHFE